MKTEKRFTISDIRQANMSAGHFFFSPDTMRHFGDRVKDWGVIHKADKVFIHHKRTGQVREFFPISGFIGLPLQGTTVDDLK